MDDVDSIVKTQLINGYASPEVNFSGTPQSGCFPLAVQFTDLSSAGQWHNRKLAMGFWRWDIFNRSKPAAYLFCSRKF